jgi:hypothetical protein
MLESGCGIDCVESITSTGGEEVDGTLPGEVTTVSSCGYNFMSAKRDKMK